MTQSYDVSELEIDTDEGAIVFRNRVVGEFDGQNLVLNAAWCRLAGLGIRVDGDSSDRRKVLLDRSIHTEIRETVPPQNGPSIAAQVQAEHAAQDPEPPAPPRAPEPADPEPLVPTGDPWSQPPAQPQLSEELPGDDPTDF